jgi:hypothetical protein
MKARSLVSTLVFLAACTTAREGTSAPKATSRPVDSPSPVAPTASESAKHAPETAEPSAPLLAAADRNPSPLREPTDWEADDSQSGKERERGATERRSSVVKKLFADAGVTFPAAEIYFRAFKAEARLEVWANAGTGDPMKPIATYGICKMSGDIGPKRQEGDSQVPEGFYELSFLKNDSAYHLAMRVSYPNAFDRKEATGSPGGAIMVHGNCVSIGCVAMSDERIEELWTMVRPIYDKKHKVALHVFPSRDIDALVKNEHYVKHRELWRILARAMHGFDADHLQPKIGFDDHHNYVFE